MAVDKNSKYLFYINMRGPQVEYTESEILSLKKSSVVVFLKLPLIIQTYLRRLHLYSINGN